MCFPDRILCVHGVMCREVDPCDVRLYVIPSTKVDRALKKLEDRGYDAGPEPSSDFTLCEGDHLELAFRGNVKCVDQQPRLNAVFTTNMDTTVCMHIEQHDVFVQKSYDVYRGFVQLRTVTKIPLSPAAVAAAAAAAASKKAAAAGGAPAAVAPSSQPPPQQQQQQQQDQQQSTPADAAAEAPQQEGEAAAGGGATVPAAAAATAAAGTVGAAGDASALPPDEPEPAEEPPLPMYEIKVTMVQELLITFPKV